jgi:hypothetical protein
MMTGRDVGGDVPSEMTAICAFETFERRLELTFSGHSRSRRWKSLLGKKHHALGQAAA